MISFLTINYALPTCESSVLAQMFTRKVKDLERCVCENGALTYRAGNEIGFSEVFGFEA